MHGMPHNKLSQTHTHTHTLSPSSVVEISEEHVTIPGNAFAMSPMTKEMAFDPINYNANSAVIPRANTYSKVEPK